MAPYREKLCLAFICNCLNTNFMQQGLADQQKPLSEINSIIFFKNLATGRPRTIKRQKLTIRTIAHSKPNNREQDKQHKQNKQLTIYYTLFNTNTYYNYIDN